MHPDKSDLEEDQKIKVLTRDQVVDFLTLNLAPAANSGSQEPLYKCFYCDIEVVGTITELKEHFHTMHPQEQLKVKTFTGKGTTGYLECQLCGHLTPGLERSPQKMHFHEEHPFETTVNASKYVAKAKGQVQGQVAQPQPTDLTRFIGEVMRCPKDDCNFEAKTLSAINNHLRRHTQTFKCGHCGKTHSNSSEFHQHSAMSHGDKIPDLVKDPEAEAEFEALRALLEHELLAGERAKVDEPAAEPQKGVDEGQRRNTARKSTGARKSSNFARKSTGGARADDDGEYSFYGLPFEEVNISEISTRMSCGGMEITLNAAKMSELVNLKPKVLVKDHYANSSTAN